MAAYSKTNRSKLGDAVISEGAYVDGASTMAKYILSLTNANIEALRKTRK